MILIKEIQDIQNLINGKIKESLTLEYKKEIGKNEEIAKDISAFANTSGGVIIYGVEEKDGIPVSFNWIESKGIKERIENVLLSKILPKLEEYKIKQINNPNNKAESVYIITVQESINAPHMANYKYYKRHNFQSVPIDDYGVKEAILKKGLKEALIEEINFNIILAKKTYEKTNEIMIYNHNERKPITFIPLREGVWKSMISSGLFHLIKKKTKELIEAYNLIYEINYLIELQKHGMDMVVTQVDDSKPHVGTYIPMLIRDKIHVMVSLLLKVKEVIETSEDVDEIQ